MFHYTTNQTTAASSRRSVSTSDRHAREQLPSNSQHGSDAYFQPYDGSSRGGHSRSASDFSTYTSHSHPTTLRQSYPVMEMEDEDLESSEDEEAMEILYEDQLPIQHHQAVNTGSSTGDLDLQLADSADHLLALLQREANDYSVPLPVRYYPTEFIEPETSETNESGEKSKKTTIGPWRKRIASWMYDVVDHFQYDRNVVSIALRYIDQYVGHLLVENAKNMRRADSIERSRGNGGSGSSSSQPIKRRHFQLIAVTSLYLAIKVHGELMENDPISGAEYDVVDSLVNEVDGRMFLGKPLSESEKIDDEKEDEDASSQESDEDLRAVSHKITDLKRRQRKGRWNMGRLSQFGLPLGHHGERDNYANDLSSRSAPKQPAKPHSNMPYKPRRRGMLGGPLRLHSFVELSRGLFTSNDIIDTETKILKALNYVVNPPTSRRFAGELLRLLTLSYCSSVDDQSTNTGATATAAERILGLDRKQIMQNVLKSACKQIEGAASVPALSIGSLPSVVAYGAILNAVEEEFEKVATSSSSPTMEMEKGQPQLEDFQRHYRRYSRNQSPLLDASKLESDREIFLEAWKEQFLVTVNHATNSFLSPDSQDIYNVSELLLDQIKDSENGAASMPAASPTEISKTSSERLKKRSPRSPQGSPRSITTMNGTNPGMLRGSSFFQSQGSSLSRQGSSSLVSPYDSRGRTVSTSGIEDKVSSFRRSSGISAQRGYYHKQHSEPIVETANPVTDGRFARAQTPDVVRISRQRYEGSWRSTGEAFQPPNPNPPFFSA